jgi:type I restriction enzyme, R subunit
MPGNLMLSDALSDPHLVRTRRTQVVIAPARWGVNVQRIQKTGEHDLALTAEGTAELRGFGEGAGGAKEQEKSLLSELIEKFNDKFGTDFTDQDVITPFAEAKADPKVRAAAVNDEENFGLVFDEVFEDKMAEHTDTIDDMGRQYFSHDDSFKQSLNQSARRAAWRMIRREENIDDEAA